MISPAADGTRGAVRLAVLDDNPFVRDPSGAVRPQAALFHRFAAAVVAAGGLPTATYLAPVRDLADGAPTSTLEPVDPACLRLVPTAPFDGIAGYLRHGPSLARRNWPTIRDAVADADLLWIKAPASNAALAALAARRAHVPRFTWVAGSVRDVVAGGGGSGLQRAAGTAVAIAYDSTTRLLERTGPSIRLGHDLFTSVVTDAEVDATRATPAREAGPFRIAWAGRLAADKGVADLLDATASLVADGRSARLMLIGDGPIRPEIEARIAALGLRDVVDVHGYVGDRESYMAALREADVFVLPSHAEGMPKVIVEAMAAGLPVVATAVGAVPGVLGNGALGRVVPVGDPGAMAAAIGALADDPEARVRLRTAGLAFAADHTIHAQARRMVSWMSTTFPDLPWGRQ